MVRLMKAKNRIAALALLLVPLAGCSDESQAATKDALGKAVDAAAGAANALADEIKSIDVSALTPEALRSKGAEAWGWIVKQLGSIRDSATAEKVAKAVGPVLDTASGFLKKAAAELPSRSEIKAQVDALREQHEGDEGVMKHLDPLLAKLSEILG